MIDAAGKGWPPPICTGIHNPQEAQIAVREMHEQGYDRVKVYSFLDKDSYDAIIATAKQVRMPVDGHVPYATSVEYVLSSGQDMIAHTEEILKFAKTKTPEEAERYASLLAKSDTWIAATLMVNRNINEMLAKPESDALSKPGVEYLHPMGVGIWNYLYHNRYKRIPDTNRRELAEGYQSFQRPLTYALFKKGAKLLTGTDPLMPPTLPGVSMHEELEELVSVGLTPYDALKVSTTNTFEFLNERDTAGSIEPGKKANLVLLDKNPLESISNTRTILGVMTQNRWIPKEEIDRRLKEIANSYLRLKSKKQGPSS
jgi:imidazolonepropionase-like amidohydrolase